ncbi:MAG: MiaB/RimO family radical SAM methylthiotransferase [Propionibacteriaceae bacterium]|nr:MiaB/RimO family radical SAM methylthiotransferase [Propionibacteriaceae bacterium]
MRLGCARNDVDAEELAGALTTDGFELVAEPTQADTIMVNTCGFIDAAKRDSIDQLLAAAQLKLSGQAKHVVMVGCLAQRYGAEIAAELPEVDAVLSFNDYPEIADRLRLIAAGGLLPAQLPVDRRTVVPNLTASPGVDRVVRRRLDLGVTAPLKIATGCDRHCAFCAIPAIRGSYISRPLEQIVAEAQWLAENGVVEALLVSENSSSYGKDIPGVGLPELLAALSTTDLEWLRVTYLQPAEMRPALIEAICGTEHVVPYFDLPFQHAAAGVLKRMRRYGDGESFLALLDSIKVRNPQAGVRTNVIVGFPGESEADLEVLADFLASADLDAIGVFGYSNEEGTHGYTLNPQLSESEIAARVEWITSLCDELMAQRAAARIGQVIDVLFSDEVTGRGFHQGSEDGQVTLIDGMFDGEKPNILGSITKCKVVGSEGIDLIVSPQKG